MATTKEGAFIIAMKRFANAATHFAYRISRRAKQVNWMLTVGVAGLVVSSIFLVRTEWQARVDKKTRLAVELRRARDDASDLLTHINRERSKEYMIRADDPDGRKRSARTEVLRPWVEKAGALQMRIADYEHRIEGLAAGSRSYAWAGSIENERAALQAPAAAELRAKQEFIDVVKAIEKFGAEARALRPLHSDVLLRMRRESPDMLNGDVSK